MSAQTFQLHDKKQHLSLGNFNGVNVLTTINSKGVLMASISLVLYATMSSVSNKSYAETTDTQIQKLLIQCSQIKVESTRLECYDQVLLTGSSDLLATQKKKIDLAETLRLTISGNPEIVVDDPNRLYEVKPFNPNNGIAQEQNVDVTKKVDSLNFSNASMKDTDVRPASTTKVIEGEGGDKQTDNSFFLNTEVIRKYYATGSYQNADKAIIATQKSQPIRSTNSDGQILSSDQDSNLAQTAKSDENGSAGSNDSTSNISGGKYSSLSLMYDLDNNSELGLWKPRPHNPMYLIPLYMHDEPNRSPSTPTQEAVNYSQNDYRSPELKFQLSFKSKVAQDLFGTDADLWLGYTQQSHWQVYNEDNSRPFRAHDYMPELFITQPVKAELPFDGELRMLGAGFMHHSNGEDDPLSRSWNKLYIMGGAEWGNLTIMPRLAFRLNTDTSSKPDDNPDIEDYYGYGDLRVFYDMDSGKSLAGTFRLNPSTGKGAAEIDYIYPMDNNVNLFLNVFHGYGESIIDYNHEDTAVGIGVMLNDWRGL